MARKRKKQVCNAHSIICHGKTEREICERIMRENRLKSNIYGNNHGNSSVQINGLLKWLKGNKIFRSKAAYTKHFEVPKSLEHEIKIFIVMDIDDCNSESDVERYINGEMFKGFWAEKYIIPIYWNKNFEEVCKKIGFDLKGNSKPYTKLLDKNYEIIRKLLEKCKKEDSNIGELMNFAKSKKKTMIT